MSLFTAAAAHARVAAEAGGGCVQASLDVTTESLPSSGVLQVALQVQSAAAEAYDAVAAVDTFMLTAKDWVGQAGRQLQYEFRFLQASCPALGM